MSVNTYPSQKLVMTQAIATAGEETSQPVPAIIRKGKETTLRQEPGSEVKERQHSVLAQSRSKHEHEVQNPQ